ncbi:MAG TPA: PH domain-containing protein [Acidimicrobiales bacterium]|nr:PH domain-containing protein [Acidimicrobiales bacterium]
MPFPRKLLNDDEDVVLDLHPHWWFFAPHIAALVGTLAIGVALLALVKDPPGALLVVAGLLLIGCLLVFGVRYSQWITINFVVTTDRLIYRHGVIAKHGIEIPLERVNTVFFSQSIFERILRTGDLVIESAGERGQQSFSNVRSPSAVQNEIYKQMEDNENRKFDRIKPTGGGGGGAPGESIPEQIRDLDELRKQGLLSDAEFNQKKQELLDRM